MLYAGLDLSRKRLDVCVLDEDGERVATRAVPPDREGLFGLVRGLGGARVQAAVESMTGARFVHDTLELAGWEVGERFYEVGSPGGLRDFENWIGEHPVHSWASPSSCSTATAC